MHINQQEAQDYLTSEDAQEAMHTGSRLVFENLKRVLIESEHIPQQETLETINYHLDLAETAILLMQAVIKDQEIANEENQA